LKGRKDYRQEFRRNAMATVYVFFLGLQPFNLTFPGRHRKTSPRNRKRRKKRRTATFTIRCGEWLPVWT